MSLGDDEGVFEPVPQEERDRVRTLLETAFPTEPLPPIVWPDDRRSADAPDIEWARRMFQGKRWSEVELPREIDIMGPVGALGIRAVLYYTPAIALLALEDTVYVDTLLCILEGRHIVDPKERAAVHPLDLLPREQARAVEAALFAIREHLAPQYWIDEEEVTSRIDRTVARMEAKTGSNDSASI